MGFLVGYDTTLSSVTFYVNEDRFPCYNGRNADYVPDPIVNLSIFNRNLRFSANNPGLVDVDWGDGTKDQYPLVKISDGSYRIVFRSLDIEYKKNPDDTTWWFRKEDGSQYVPVDNHAYADGRRDVQRAVSIDFTCDIYYANIQICKMTAFPIVDIPGLEFLVVSHTMYVNDGIPVDKLSRSKKLIYIDFQNIGQE